MKNKKIKLFYLLIVFVFINTTAISQVDWRNKGVYIEVHLNIMPIPDDVIWRHLYSRYSLSGGLLIDRKHGIGVEYQNNKGILTASRGRTMEGFGINYRFTHERGLYVKASYGKLTKASYWDDDSYYVTPSYSWNKGKGGYFAANIGHHFKNGLLLGGGLSFTHSANFRRSEYDEMTDELVFVRNENKIISTFWICIGYSFPGRNIR